VLGLDFGSRKTARKFAAVEQKKMKQPEQTPAIVQSCSGLCALFARVTPVPYAPVAGTIGGSRV